VDLFKVTKVPAFFIFEPRAMKKTTVPLLEGLAEAGETTTNVIKQVIQKSLKQHDPKHNCSI